METERSMLTLSILAVLGASMIPIIRPIPRTATAPYCPARANPICMAGNAIKKLNATIDAKPTSCRFACGNQGCGEDEHAAENDPDNRGYVLGHQRKRLEDEGKKWWINVVTVSGCIDVAPIPHGPSGMIKVVEIFRAADRKLPQDRMGSQDKQHNDCQRAVRETFPGRDISESFFGHRRTATRVLSVTRRHSTGGGKLLAITEFSAQFGRAARVPQANSDRSCRRYNRRPCDAIPPPPFASRLFRQAGLDRQYSFRKLFSASRRLAGSPRPREDGNKHSDIKSAATRGWLQINHRYNESAALLVCALHPRFARQP